MAAQRSMLAATSSMHFLCSATGCQWRAYQLVTRMEHGAPLSLTWSRDGTWKRFATVADIGPRDGGHGSEPSASVIDARSPVRRRSRA